MRNLFRTFSLKNIDFILIALVVTLNIIGIIAVSVWLSCFLSARRITNMY